MAFTTFGSARTYVKYAECNPGTVLVTGTYIGEEISKFKNRVFIFENEETKEVICLNAAGKLSKFIDERCQLKDRVQITYEGKKMIAAGPMAGKEAHDFSCALDLDHRKMLENQSKLKEASKANTHTTAQFNKFVDDGDL